MSVVPFPPPAPGDCVALLERTLAFERLVESLIVFQQGRGALPEGPVSPLDRNRVRGGLLQLLNELDPRVCAAAEARGGACLARLAPLHPDIAAAVVVDVLREYRHGLRQVPLRGVGALG